MIDSACACQIHVNTELYCQIMQGLQATTEAGVLYNRYMLGAKSLLYWAALSWTLPTLAGLLDASSQDRPMCITCWQTARSIQLPVIASRFQTLAHKAGLQYIRVIQI